jgi:hypothetical protein
MLRERKKPRENIRGKYLIEGKKRTCIDNTYTIISSRVNQRYAITMTKHYLEEKEERPYTLLISNQERVSFYQQKNNSFKR